MGTNPMMGMYGMGDDFYTQMMYQQMMAGGGNNAGWGPANRTNGAGQAQQTAQGGTGIGKALTYGGVAAGAAGAGTLFTGYGLNSPVEEGAHGGVKFTDDFMKRFSSEFHGIKSEDAIKNLYKELSVATDGKCKFTVNADNYDNIMTELKALLDEEPSNRKVADMSDDLKGFLKAHLGKDEIPAGVTIDNNNRALYELIDSNLSDAKIKDIYTNQLVRATDIDFKNNLNLQRSLYDSFDDIVKEFTGCADDVAKLEYLRNNPTFARAMVKDSDDLAKVFAGDLSVLQTKDTAKSALKTGYESIEKSMQAFAKKWDGKVGFLGKGKFNVFNKKTADALDNALSSLRTSKAWKHAGIAGLAIAGATLLFNA